MGALKKLLIKNKLLFPLSLKIQNWFYKFFYNNFHQISNFTFYDRYPQLFAFAKTHLKNSKQRKIKILCYGCSSGEECFSLNNYFENADIFGLDSNKKVLLKAKNKNTFPNISFLHSTAENLAKHGPYDLIFAMAVFCRWPSSNYYTDISSLYPFKRFDKSIRELDKVLKENGLFVINNANFQFLDSSVSSKYELLETPDGVENEIVPKFSKENKSLGLTAKNEIIFRKIK